MNAWREMPLGNVVTFQRGFDLPYRERRPGHNPVVTSAGVTDFHAKSMVEPPGVVTGRYGTIGNLFFIDQPFWPLNTTLYVRDFHGNDPKFIYFLLQMFDFESFSGKSGVPGVNRNDLHKEPVCIPESRAEQNKIANTLSDIELLIYDLERIIAKKHHIKQATMQELLTGKRRLPGFEGEWVEVVLGKHAKFFKGKGLPKSDLTPYGEYGCVHYGELFTLYNESIRETRSYTHKVDNLFFSAANDVLMPTSDVTPRGLAKASCICRNGIVIGGDILVIRPNPGAINGTFLSYLIRRDSAQILRLVTGSTVYHIYSGDMKRFAFHLPTVIEQEAIVELLDDLGAELESLEVSLGKAQAIMQGMMQQLLTGKIRLR
jgi:type I restriction enzyme S subunit